MASSRKRSNKKGARSLIGAIERLNENIAEQNRQFKVFNKRSSQANLILIGFTAILIIGTLVQLFAINNILGATGIIIALIFLFQIIFGLNKSESDYFSNISPLHMAVTILLIVLFFIMFGSSIGNNLTAMVHSIFH